ncbi:replication-associated recombination protein A [Clostridium oceanicum]|uniref:Replication-associated recombination protein A n=1 Tax=Clostridium oceanicum TaxID=1543 RepID=A0ABP3V104_9CLOT
MNKPLAERIRPRIIEDVVGQKHLIGKGKILYSIVNNGRVPNMIFYGPPGVGKTTIANIISKKTEKKLYKLNATSASVSDIKNIVENSNSLLGIKGILLYLDEIQNFNKKQQQALLEYTENGRITLIASTTENPNFYIYKALLSRCMIFEFKPLNVEDIILGLKKAIISLKKELNSTDIIIDEMDLKYISENSSGDLRKAINILEVVILNSYKDKDGNIVVKKETINECSIGDNINYDKFGDSHYDTISAFQKSIRGSDVNAGLHYLARLIKGGDLITICRRLLVIASEDIGLAYPNAITIVKSCVDSAMQLGFPEAKIPLSQAVILLCNSPKSNSAYVGIKKALEDIENKNVGEIPNHIRDGHYSGAKKLGRMVSYKYPYNYNNNYVDQQYLPDNIKTAVYYKPSNNKMEKSMYNYIESIKNNRG